MWAADVIELAVVESCERSGVPRFVEDPVALARVAALASHPKELAS